MSGFWVWGGRVEKGEGDKGVRGGEGGGEVGGSRDGPV